MADNSNLISNKKLVSVVMTSSGSREITLSNLKQLFSMKPEHWQLDVHLIIEGANEVTLSMIDSLDLQLAVVPVSGAFATARAKAKIAAKLSKDSDAVLWLGANTAFKSDTYNQIENFHRQYPSAILVGQFQDEISGQICAGGHRKSGAFRDSKDLAHAQILPADIASFDDKLVFVPSSASIKLGQPARLFNQLNKSSFYVGRAKRKQIRCLAIPGYLGTVLR